MKAQQTKEFLKDLQDRGWVEHNNVFYTPTLAAAMCLIAKQKKIRAKPGIKTGDVTDYRNIANKEKTKDPFIIFVQLELQKEVWPEFYFTIDRQWRFDWCFPEDKIYIEVEGGVWTGGRHTRGKGFVADMEKYNRAAELGWRMIRVVPDDLVTIKTINLVKNAMLL